MDENNMSGQNRYSQEPRPDYSVPPPQGPPPKKMGKFKASKLIAITCWNLLQKDREIMLFPIAAFFANLALVAAFMLFMFFGVYGGSFEAFDAATEEGSSIGYMQYLYMLVYYVISYFIVSFFEVGIVAIVNGRLSGKDLTFMDGINGARRIIGKIFVWSLISATVGMILRTIAERSKLVGKIVVFFLGAAWNILTYFVVPILYLEDMPIEGSLKRSANTIKKTWGETAILHLGVGLFFTVLMFGGIAISIILMVLLQGVGAIIIGILMVVYIILLAILGSAFGSIFRVVLYKYATTGELPEGFSKDTLDMAFKQK